MRAPQGRRRSTERNVVTRAEDREGAPDPQAIATPFRRAEPDPLLQSAISALPGYRTPTARRDVLAGVTAAALAIPSAMAYAELAGLPAVAALYALLLLPTVTYTLLGSSRQLIVGPEGSRPASACSRCR